MATYIPNPQDPTQPTEDKFVESAAAEFRALKEEVIELEQKVDDVAGDAHGELLAVENRSLRVPAPETVPVLSAAGIRANKLLGFDSGGSPVVVLPGAGTSSDVFFDLADTSDVGKGDALIGVKQPFPGSVARTQHDRNSDLASVRDFGALGNNAADDGLALQAALNAGVSIMPPGIYLTSIELVFPDGSGFVGRAPFFKRRTGYVYNINKHTVIKYIGPAGLNTCVLRLSKKPVGQFGTNFAPPNGDDLSSVTLTDVHVDCNNLADYGVYVYRAGNQSTIGNVTCEKAVKFNHVHMGCFAAKFGVFGSYESRGSGVACGWDIFNWLASGGSAGVEATNFAYSATFLTANNGTAQTYVAGSATDLDGSGGWFSVGRGSNVKITSEANFGRACVLSMYHIANGASGPVDYTLDYIEANKDGPYVDYRNGMEGLRLKDGFLHPGNGTTLLPQNIKIVGKDNAGVVTPDIGPVDSSEWLVLDGLMGDTTTSHVSVSSNTFKYIVRNCTRHFVITGSHPGKDDYIATVNQVSASVYFTATAVPTIWNAVNGTLTRTGVGTYQFTFARPVRVAVVATPMVSIITGTVLGNNVRVINFSTTHAVIRTYDAAEVAADTGDRIAFMMAGHLVYEL